MGRCEKWMLSAGDVCSRLPEMHVLTGCDSTSSLYDIGKKVAFSQKHEGELDRLKNLGWDYAALCYENVCVSFKFIRPSPGEATSNVNHLRYQIFTKKNVDSNKLPSTKTVLDIMSNELTTSVSSGSMLEIASYHCSHLMEIDGQGTTWHILYLCWWGNVQLLRAYVELVVCWCQKGCNARSSYRNAGLSCTTAWNCKNECGHKS